MAKERLIASLDDYPEEGIFKIRVDEQSLLLVINQTGVYLIENKCGHFGVPLQNGHLRNNEIVCAGISIRGRSGFKIRRSGVSWLFIRYPWT
jgi:nitrite reductase/ring-hydroxylating ferredoxin subunit